MQELLQQLNSILRGMWKYRRVGVAVAWVVAAAGAVGVLLMPDRFEASARVYVDTQTILRPLMAGLAVQPNVDQQVTMLSRTLINRPTVEKLMQMAQLETAGQTKAQRDALVDNLFKFSPTASHDTQGWPTFRTWPAADALHGDNRGCAVLRRLRPGLAGRAVCWPGRSNPRSGRSRY